MNMDKGSRERGERRPRHQPKEGRSRSGPRTETPLVELDNPTQQGTPQASQPVPQIKTTNLFAASDTATKAEGSNGKQRGGKGRCPLQGINLSDMKLLTISALAVFYRLRQAESALYTVITIASTTSMATSLLEVGDHYHIATVGLSGHGKGPPHPYLAAKAAVVLMQSGVKKAVDAASCFLTTVGGAMQTYTPLHEEVIKHKSEADQHGKTTQDIIDILNAKQEANQRKLIAQELQVFRGRTCRNKDKYNITIASKSTAEPITSFMKELIIYLEAQGGEVHYGMAPPSQNEHQLKELLARIEKHLDK